MTRKAREQFRMRLSQVKPRFQRAIEAAEALTLPQRETLVNVLRQRNRDARRREIEG
jgi:hypothetical protein